MRFVLQLNLGKIHCEMSKTYITAILNDIIGH